MKKLLTLLLVLVSAVSWGAGTTVETSGKSTIQTGPASFTQDVSMQNIRGDIATFTGAVTGSILIGHGVWNLDTDLASGSSAEAIMAVAGTDREYAVENGAAMKWRIIVDGDSKDQLLKFQYYARGGSGWVTAFTIGRSGHL